MNERTIMLVGIIRPDHILFKLMEIILDNY
jgi:hypothetical protein